MGYCKQLSINDQVNEMNLDEAFPSKFLKSADIGDAGTEVLVTIKEIKGLTTFDDGGKSLDVEFYEFDKILGMNKTNRESTAIYLKSRNTDDWVNKKVTLYVDLVRNKSGNMVEALRVKPAPRTMPASVRAAVASVGNRTNAPPPYPDPEDPGFDDDSDIPF